MEKDIKRHKLFVYGTLKKKHRLNSLLVDEVFVGDYVTKDNWYGMSSYLGSFPMVYYSDVHNHQIVGELYEVTTLNYDQILAMEYNAGFIPIQVAIENMNHVNKPHSVMSNVYETALMFLIPDSNGIEKDVNYYQKQDSTIITKDNRTEWIHVR
tara:strand:- start:21 stop:482 length:462 start_codon:yes stop_codon:yes gene_type:complete